MAHWHKAAIRLECGCEVEVSPTDGYEDWWVGDEQACPAGHGAQLVVRVSRSGCR